MKVLGGEFSVRGAAALALSVAAGAAHADGGIERLPANLQRFVDYGRDIDDSQQSMLGSAEARDLSSGERNHIKEYYRNLREGYLVRPIESSRPSIVEAVAKYQRSVKQAFTDLSLNDCAYKEFKRQDFALLDRASAAADAMLRSAAESVRGVDERAGYDASAFKRFVDLTSHVPTVAGVCCERAYKDDKDKCSKLNETLEAARGALDDEAKAPVAVSPPDPSQNGVRAKQLVDILDNSKNARELRTLHNSRDAEAEGEIFEEASNCSEKKKKNQTDTNPLARWAPFAMDFAKAMKCQIGPALATRYLDLGAQKMVVGMAGAPVKGEGIDLECDPREVAMWDQARSTDPNVVAQQWGIPQLGNPPWIANLRTLQPLQVPLIVPGPNGSLVIQNPVSNRGLPIIIGNPIMPSSSTTGIGSSVPIVGSSAGVALSAASLRSSGTSAGRGTAISRGLTQGTELTRAARQASSQIASGNNAQANASALHSGASITRRSLAQMVSNNQALGDAGRRSLATASAATARGLVAQLATTTASRTTAQGVLNAIQASRVNVLPAGGTAPVSRVQQIDQQREKNEAERRRLGQIAALYAANIQTAKQKADEVLAKIQKMIMDRDAVVNGLMDRIFTKNPKKQGEEVIKTRRELITNDKEISLLKAEYDIYAASVAENKAHLDSLAIFGNNAPELPGFGGSMRRPDGAPVLPTGRGGRGSSASQVERVFDKLASLLNPLPSALAAIEGGGGFFASEEEWEQAWSKYQKDYANYVAYKMNLEHEAKKKAAQALREMSEGINEQNMRDNDTETVVAMDIFTRALEEESDEIIKEADRPKSTVRVAGGVIALLRTTREEAQGARQALSELHGQYLRSYPQSYEDNPEVWWAMLPEMLVY